MVIPQKTSKVKRFTIPTLFVKIGLAAAVVSVLLMGLLIFDYINVVGQVAENKTLKVENLMLKQRLRNFQVKMASISSTIARIRTFATKLKIITNLEEADSQLNLSIGPLGKSGPTQPGDLHMGDENTYLSANMDLFDSNFEDELNDALVDIESIDTSLIETNPKKYLVLLDKSLQDLEGAALYEEQGVMDLSEMLMDQKSLLSSTPSIMPVKGWLTSPFGLRINPFTRFRQMHEGLDIANRVGAKIHAPSDGYVTFVGKRGGYGNLIAIDHGYGVTTRFGHLSSTNVKPGDKVTRGDIIGRLGDSGKSTGPHLHYEVRRNGIPVNPHNYIIPNI